MRFTWNELKRRRNLRNHGLDFKLVEQIFDGYTKTKEDRRFEYTEQRFRTIGLLCSEPVVVIYTETEGEVHVISLRKATRREATELFDNSRR